MLLLPQNRTDSSGVWDQTDFPSFLGMMLKIWAPGRHSWPGNAVSAEERNLYFLPRVGEEGKGRQYKYGSWKMWHFWEMWKQICHVWDTVWEQKPQRYTTYHESWGKNRNDIFRQKEGPVLPEIPCGWVVALKKSVIFLGLHGKLWKLTWSVSWWSSSEATWPKTSHRSRRCTLLWCMWTFISELLAGISCTLYWWWLCHLWEPAPSSTGATK